MLLTDRQVANLCKAFASNSLADIKLSKTQLPKMIQSGGFLGRVLGPVLETGLPLIKYVIKSVAKSVLIPLGLTAADAGILKKNLGSGNNTTALIISNVEMEDIMEIFKSLEDSGLLLKRVSETIQIETKEQKGGFLSMLLDPLGTSLLGNMLAGKGITKAGYGSKDFQSKKGKGIIRAGYQPELDF